MLLLNFWFVLMIQVKDPMGKPNPHSLDRLFIIAVSRLNKPGVKELACPGKSEALWKEPTELHRVGASQQEMFPEEVGFPVGKRLLDLLRLMSLKWRGPFLWERGLNRGKPLPCNLPSVCLLSLVAKKHATVQDGSSQFRAVQVSCAQICPLQICPTKHRIAQIGSVQIGITQVEFRQIKSAQIKPSECRVTEFRMVKIHTIRFGITQMCTTQISPVEISIVEIGSLQISIAEVGPTEIGSLQVGPTQVRTMQIHVGEINMLQILQS